MPSVAVTAASAAAAGATAIDDRHCNIACQWGIFGTFQLSTLFFGFGLLVPIAAILESGNLRASRTCTKVLLSILGILAGPVLYVTLSLLFMYTPVFGWDTGTLKDWARALSAAMGFVWAAFVWGYFLMGMIKECLRRRELGADLEAGKNVELQETVVA